MQHEERAREKNLLFFFLETKTYQKRRAMDFYAKIASEIIKQVKKENF